MVDQERDEAKRVRWMCNVTPQDRICTEKPRNQKAILKSKNMRECYHGRRLQWSDYLERIKERAWSDKFRTSNPPEFS